MLRRVAACSIATCLMYPAVAGAQSVAERPAAPGSSPAKPSPTITGTVPFSTRPLFELSKGKPSGTGFWAPFQVIPNDFVQFFSADTMKVVSVGSVGAFAAHQWDGQGIEESQEHVRPSLFKTGNIGGGFLVQAGASVGLYSIGRLGGSQELAAVGADLIRAQVLSQGIVQAAKFATRRPRPDASNNHSLPSGHTAAAFATATVLQDHFGWKVGVPAYGFGSYVAASRMSANKHYLSDVLLGAAIGVAAGRTVTIGSGKARFQMRVAPTPGGAAVAFTKH
jgi:hypothetical protein